ncbi:MAG: hypothetical protein KF776_04035 [Burkholderiales bacterium]|nr:hypothetical protein [Burkholderiales bacterium]MCL4689730.1 hypothetical protein [Burkholderiales bacterium]
MPQLADLLDDNAALQATHAILAGAGHATAGIEQALRLVRDIANATPHEDTRRACAVAEAALQGLPHYNSPAAWQATLAREGASRARPETSLAERDVLLVRRQFLRDRLAGPAAPAMPRIAHLVKTDGSPGDLPLLPYLCYRSVLAQCAGWRFVLHAPARPRGPRWEALLPHLDLDIAAPPQWLGDRRLVAAAHQSDVWRVKSLVREGGFYFDWDLLLLRAPEGLRGEACVMALERREEGFDEVLGVSAIGARAGSAFLEAWLEAMPAVYNPSRYVAHSTVLARRLAMRHPSLVRVLGHRAFYHPGWTEPAMAWLLDPAQRLPPDELHGGLADCTGIHLFCSHANFLRWTRDFTERDIERPRCNLATLMQPYL